MVKGSLPYEPELGSGFWQWDPAGDHALERAVALANEALLDLPGVRATEAQATEYGGGVHHRHTVGRGGRGSMESYEDIVKRMEDAYREESGQEVEAVSDLGLRLRVLAGELYRLQAGMDWLWRQAFPQTATGEQLDRHGAQRGLARREGLPRPGGADLQPVPGPGLRPGDSRGHLVRRPPGRRRWSTRPWRRGCSPPGS